MTAAKAGVCTSLPARTSVIAAANPSGGHYTRAKTISENVKLSSAMLSRFDITFLLLDRPDEALDGRLSEHILAMHSGAIRHCIHPNRSFPKSLVSYCGSPGTRSPLLLTLHRRTKQQCRDQGGAEDAMPEQETFYMQVGVPGRTWPRSGCWSTAAHPPAC